MQQDTKIFRTKMLSKIFLDSVDSTNDKAKEFIGKKDNLVIISDEQVSGKGRFDRTWKSFKGGIYLSILLKEEDIEKVKILTFSGALSVVKAIKEAAFLEANTKWPNDVYLNGKKICGILTETVLGHENHIIIGIGINVNQKSFDTSIKDTATSLSLETGKEFDKKKIIDILLRHFENYYKLYKDRRYDLILDEFKKNCFLIGREAEIKTIKDIYKGKVTDIDDRCDLILELENKETKKIIEGDITLI